MKSESLTPFRWGQNSAFQLKLWEGWGMQAECYTRLDLTARTVDDCCKGSNLSASITQSPLSLSQSQAMPQPRAIAKVVL
eukprot:556894-Amphidinium_carterae.1